MQRISLGGAETHVARAQRHHASILASPEFKKLVASTDNFILRAVVKEKDAAPAMGGKYVSRSKKDKKRTLKRGKRSRTTHRMGGRKLKTKAQIKKAEKRQLLKQLIWTVIIIAFLALISGLFVQVFYWP